MNSVDTHKDNLKSNKITFRKKAERDKGADIALPIIRRDFEENRKNRNCFLSDDGRFIYHVGIIDYLQDFNFDKVVENKYKSLISDGQMISAVHPKLYCQRFFDFMQS